MCWPKGQKHTQETKNKMSVTRKGKPSPMKGKHHSQKTKDLMKGRQHTQEARDRMSKSRKGRVSNMKGKQHTQETKDRCREVSLKAWQNSEYRKNQVEGMKMHWSDPEWAEKQMNKALEGSQKAHPNKPEKQVMEILKSLSSDIRYVGDGKYWEHSMNPDFINEETKQIIEVFGCYWHCCKKCRYPNKDRQRQNDSSRISKFKALGYSVFVIWEHDLKERNTIAQRIQRFVS